MKIIHNLLFSIYFWANSLHNAHIHPYRAINTAEQRCVRSYVCTMFVHCPKRFSIAVIRLTNKKRWDANSHARSPSNAQTNRQQNKKLVVAMAAVAAAKWNFHSTFIYFFFLFFSLREFGVVCVCVPSFILFFDSLALSSASWRDTLKMLMSIWLLFKYFTKDRMIYFDFFARLYCDGGECVIHSSSSRNSHQAMLTLGLSCFMCFVMDRRLLSTFVVFACQSNEKGH